MGETIKRDLKAWDIPRDLCLNRGSWCVSTLAYPTCFGLTDFVVVVRSKSIPASTIYNSKVIACLDIVYEHHN
jgi:hypothetical protein